MYKILCVSILLTAVGILSIALEYTFYQYIDESGLLHESMFLPFGFFAMLLGFAAALIFGCSQCYKMLVLKRH